jgi:hypothetical protein
MRWRDIRFEKPTEADGDQWSRILILHKNSYFALVSHENTNECIAWMPLSELPAFDRIPNPPENYRFVQKGEKFDYNSKIWNKNRNEWVPPLFDYYHDDYVYIVPIGPPDPPEGWRLVDKEKDTRKDLAKFWDEVENEWKLVNPLLNYWLSTHTYIVPIDPPNPPEPQYRHFANAAEFEPHKDRWWRYKSQFSDEQNSPANFSDQLHAGQYWQDSFKNKVFSDGTPFGVKVE